MKNISWLLVLLTFVKSTNKETNIELVDILNIDLMEAEEKKSNQYLKYQPTTQLECNF